MPFLYLRDRLFLMSLALYGINRFMIKPHIDGGFFHNHFNDLLCIPIFVPIVVFVARTCRFRLHDLSPQIHEILLPLIVWSIMFELLLPQHSFWSRWVVGDPYDILWYSTGAFIAFNWWHVRYAKP